MKRLVLNLLILLTTVIAMADVIEMNGVYQGKNLYVENGFAPDGESFCITNIYVNDKRVMTYPDKSAFELDLSYLGINTPVKIRIYHKKGCTPKVLNEQVIQYKSHFSFVSITVDADGVNWESKGEEGGGEFYVQRFQYGKWRTLKVVHGKKSRSANNYSHSPVHTSGNNKYRIKYVETETKFTFYSNSSQFSSKKEEVKFYPLRVTDYITFIPEEPVEYELFDLQGHLLKRGKSQAIDCRDLASNTYYKIHFDNQVRKFLKKK